MRKHSSSSECGGTHRLQHADLLSLRQNDRSVDNLVELGQVECVGKVRLQTGVSTRPKERFRGARRDARTLRGILLVSGGFLSSLKSELRTGCGPSCRVRVAHDVQETCENREWRQPRPSASALRLERTRCSTLPESPQERPEERRSCTRETVACGRVSKTFRSRARRLGTAARPLTSSHCRPQETCCGPQ